MQRPTTVYWRPVSDKMSSISRGSTYNYALNFLSFGMLATNGPNSTNIHVRALKSLYSTPQDPLNAIPLQNMNIYNFEGAQRDKTDRIRILRLCRDVLLFSGGLCRTK